ncbi:MAG TPA: phosphodiester glycosidase family protein [Gaiellaceae bacterium]|nr:phosphodiester glycosidase family protein [Gaiellaceae bacterium]
MARPAVIVALAALVLSAPAATQPSLLMPGVTYEQQVQFTFHGPSAIHVLTMPRPGGLWSLKPVLSNDVILGTERVTAIQQRLSQAATVAGVNGDRFVSSGRPSGILMRGGALEHGPGESRSSIGFDSTGGLRVERVRLLPTWQGTGQRQNLAAVNNSPSSSGTSLYTAVWGPATPVAPSSVEVVIRPFPATVPNTEISGTATEVRSGGATPIPPDGAVLVARGAAATTRVRNEAPVGTTVRVRLVLQPDWAGVVDAIGGGPALVRDGKAIFNAGEAFVPSQLALPEPRTAVGQLADGRVVLVVVDGRQRGYSSGMTNFELALALVRLGVVTGAALDGGGSSTMAFDGKLLNRPSDGRERPVSEALLVAYTGVQAPLPAVSVLSPNGDGVAESQSLAYKVVRPSTVRASLLAPDGSTRTVFEGPAAPGTYPVTWSGRTPEGVVELEGRWRWVVTAVDDRGQSSSFERPFSLNTTLGFGKPVPPALSVPRRRARPVAQFELARSASVTTRIETSSGTIVRKAEPAVAIEPGAIPVLWDGRTSKGATVHSGTYVARTTARNAAGSVSLTAKFTVRRTGSRKGRGVSE